MGRAGWVAARVRARTFSSKTKHERRAAVCSTVSGLKAPLKISSVRSSSSPVEISHATRPLSSMTSLAVVYPSLDTSRHAHASRQCARERGQKAEGHCGDVPPKDTLAALELLHLRDGGCLPNGLLERLDFVPELRLAVVRLQKRLEARIVRKGILAEAVPQRCHFL